MKITKGAQKAAADILTRFMFVKDMEDVYKAWVDVYEKYDLYDDPFTGCPCTFEEFCRMRQEYDRQTMMERYGHCDGLD